MTRATRRASSSSVMRGGGGGDGDGEGDGVGVTPRTRLRPRSWGAGAARSCRGRRIPVEVPAKNDVRLVPCSSRNQVSQSPESGPCLGRRRGRWEEAAAVLDLLVARTAARRDWRDRDPVGGEMPVIGRWTSL